MPIYLKTLMITVIIGSMIFLHGCSTRKERLQVGIIAPSTNHLPLLIALEEELLSETDLQIHRFASGWEANEALINGKIDLAIVPFTYAWQARSERKGVRIISFLERESDGIIARCEINRVEELEGKKVGILRASTLDVFFHLIVDDLGIKPEVIYFRTPTEMAAALTSGSVDALSFYVPPIFQFDERFHPLLWYSDYFPEHPCCDIMVFEESLERKRTQIESFLSAMQKSSEILQDDPERGVVITIEHFGYDREVAEWTLRHQKFITGLDDSGKLFQQKVASKMAEMGYLREDVDPTEVFYDIFENQD